MNTKERIAIPKGGMCKTCTKFQEDCSELDFESMPKLNCDLGKQDYITVRCTEYDRKAKPKPTKKPVDLSVLIDSGIDCVMGDTLDDNVISPLTHFNKCPVEDSYWDDAENPWKYCRPRMNHIHAQWLGQQMARQLVLNLRYAGFKFDEYTRKVGGKTMLIIANIEPKKGYCYPWQMEECDE